MPLPSLAGVTANGSAEEIENLPVPGSLTVSSTLQRSHSGYDFVSHAHLSKLFYYLIPHALPQRITAPHLFLSHQQHHGHLEGSYLFLLLVMLASSRQQRSCVFPVCVSIHGGSLARPFELDSIWGRHHGFMSNLFSPREKEEEEESENREDVSAFSRAGTASRDIFCYCCLSVPSVQRRKAIGSQISAM